MSQNELAGVSVLMTAYNAGPYLDEAVTSIINQTYTNWELILFDNGSTDESMNLTNLNDSRIRLFRTPENIGRTRALQICLDNATYKYTAILDADDIAFPMRLVKQVELLEAEPSIVLVGSKYIRFGTGHPRKLTASINTGFIKHDQLGERNCFVHSTTMFRTELARNIGGYDDAFEYAQDYDLFIRLATKGSCFIIDEVLVKLRIHPENFTFAPTTRVIRVRDEQVLFQKAHQLLDLSTTGRRLNRRRQAISSFTRAVYEMRLGNMWVAITCLLHGIQKDPSMRWIGYLISGRKVPK